MILAYCRVSTEDQKNGSSPEEQEKKCRAIADLRNAGPYDFHVFHDAGVSGSVPLAERPAGRELMTTVRSGDCVVASKLDRMFRNTIDALTMLKWFKEKNVDLILVDLSVEPVTSDGMGKLMFSILSMIADFERDRINARTAEGRRAKRQKGGLVSGPPPYGFSVEGRGKTAVLVPNPTEQHVVAEVIRLKPLLPSYRLMHEINRLGLRARNGKPFQQVQIERIYAYHTRERDGDARAKAHRVPVVRERACPNVHMEPQR